MVLYVVHENKDVPRENINVGLEEEAFTTAGTWLQGIGRTAYVLGGSSNRTRVDEGKQD